jgi:hypothetical protein
MTPSTNLLLAALAAAVMLAFITILLAFLHKRKPGKLNQGGYRSG